MQRPVRFILIDDEVYSNKIGRAFIKKVYPEAEIKDFLSPLQALLYIDKEYKDSFVPTAILLDINMPELNGWQLLEKLQQMPLRVKECISVFMLSSSIDPGDKQRAKEHPLISDYIEKPLSRDILKRMFEG
jgi:two-component system chemotaxis response regulator CheY